MTDATQRERIEGEILRAYRSLDAPRFDFVSVAADQGIDSALLSALRSVSSIEDDTDLNKDVCFSLRLVEDDETLFLQLSMLGRYAVAIRQERPGEWTLLRCGIPLSEFEVRVMRCLKDHGVALLGEELLLEQVEVRLPDTDPADTRLYHALFSDSDNIPWS